MAAAAAEKSAAEVLAEHGLWEGWSRYCQSIPLGPGEELKLPPQEEFDPDVLGFAMPLPPVEFAHRNERKHPPPTEEIMIQEMTELLKYSDDAKVYARSDVLGAIYDHINCNKRDSAGWQKAFIQVGGIDKLFQWWQASPDEIPEVPDDGFCDRYWVMAIIGRMAGTCAESRKELIERGAIQMILEGTKDKDDEVWECAICALKGLIQHEDGRKKVTYSMLIECLGGNRNK